MIISLPYEKSVKRKKIVIIKQAHYKEIDGERIFRPAIKEEIEEDVIIWAVNTGAESHEFANKEDAVNFHKGLK